MSSIHVLQQLSDAEKIKRRASCEDDDTSVDYIAFNVSAKLNGKNVHIWVTELSLLIAQVIRDSRKMTAFCPASQTKAYGRFVFEEATVMVMDPVKERFPTASPMATGCSSASFPCGFEGLLEREPAKGLDRTSRTHSWALFITGTYSMRLLCTEKCERPGTPTSEATSPFEREFHKPHSQCRWVTAAAYVARTRPSR